MGRFATVCSKAMVRPMLGKGSVYVWTYTSGDGEWLDGAKSYRLHLPSGIPAANFWSIVVYDVWTRSMLANGQAEASKNSYNPALAAGEDGSVDLFFGPEPPAAGVSNWIRTLPARAGSPSCASTGRSRAT
jgi:hypothetical protein